MVTDPFAAASGGVRVRIRLTPKSSANRITTVAADGDGNGFIKAMVTAAPEAGKANGALIRMLAKEWKLARSTFEVIHGKTDRNKTVLVAGETDALMRLLHQWLDNFQK